MNYMDYLKQLEMGDASSSYDPEFRRRMEELAGHRGTTLDSGRSRANDLRNQAAMITAIAGTHTTPGGVATGVMPDASPYVDIINREADSLDSFDMTELKGRASDEERISGFMRDNFEDDRTQEKEEYDRGRTRIKDDRYDAEWDRNETRYQEKRSDARIDPSKKQYFKDPDGNMQVGFWDNINKEYKVAYGPHQGDSIPDNWTATQAPTSGTSGVFDPVMMRQPDGTQVIMQKGKDGQWGYYDAATKAEITDPIAIKSLISDEEYNTKNVTTGPSSPYGSLPEKTRDKLAEKDADQLMGFETGLSGGQALSGTMQRALQLSEMINQGSWIGTGSLNDDAREVGSLLRSMGISDFDLMTSERQELQNLVAVQLQEGIKSMKGMGSLSDKDLQALENRLGTGKLTVEAMRNVVARAQAISDYNNNKYNEWNKENIKAQEEGRQLSWTRWQTQYDMANYNSYMEATIGDPSAGGTSTGTGDSGGGGKATSWKLDSRITAAEDKVNSGEMSPEEFRELVRTVKEDYRK